MKKEQFESLSNEALEKKIKSATSVLYVTLTILIIYGAYMFYRMFEGALEPGVQIAIPLFIFAAMLPNWVNIKNMKEELQKRRSSNS